LFITDASSGIGEATARLLAGMGAHVVLGARRLERLEAVATEIRAEGGRAEIAATDVARRDQVEALVRTAETAFERVDVMINNAGLMPLSRLDQTRVEDWERMIAINLKGVLYGSAAALPIMQRQQSGHIINIASTAGLRQADSSGALVSFSSVDPPEVSASSQIRKLKNGPSGAKACLGRAHAHK
jgi:NADP-dependent 3-hydroxy acid dehydrogenase YdfG